MAAGLAERGMRARHRLHVTAYADIGDDGAVGSAGNDLAVGDRIDALHHIARRAVMRTKAGAARPSGLGLLIVRDVIGCRPVPAVMTFHAQRARPRIGDGGAFGQGVLVGGPQLMGIFGTVRIMTGRAGDRLIDHVGGVGIGAAGILDEIPEAGRRVAADAVFAARAGGGAGDAGVQRLIPFGEFYSPRLRGIAVMALGAITGHVTD